MSFKHLMIIEKASLKQFTINVHVCNEKIKYLEAYMPHTSLQISNCISALEDKKKARFDLVLLRWLCTKLEKY